MPRPLQILATYCRRELVAWTLAGVTAHHIWRNGLNHWSLLMALACLGIHPSERRKQMINIQDFDRRDRN